MASFYSKNWAQEVAAGIRFMTGDRVKVRRTGDRTWRVYRWTGMRWVTA
ncbi:MAG: hypothetical protein RB191_08830 [Terriglobia bacterium]|nr:hypothetical protein [Terriglobia bacterium]